MAFLIKPKNSKTYRIGYYDNITGKQKTISAKTRIEAEARKKTKDLTAKMQLHLHKDNLHNPADHQLKISEALEFMFTQKQLSDKTKNIYALSIKHFITAIGKDKYLYQITVHDYFLLNKYFNNLTYHIPGTNITRSIAPNTKATYLRHLFSFFNFLVKTKILPENYIEKSKEEKKDIEVIPEDDLQLIFQKLKQQSKNYYNIFRLKYLAALRAMELTKIKASDFDLDKKVMTVNNLKGNRSDKIPLTDDLLFHLSEMDLPLEGYIFPFLNYNKLKTAWHRCMAVLNFNYNMHQLRKTRGTKLAEAGINPFYLKQFMRHESLKTTERYYIFVNINKSRQEINQNLR